MKTKIYFKLNLVWIILIIAALAFTIMAIY